MDNQQSKVDKYKNTIFAFLLYTCIITILTSAIFGLITSIIYSMLRYEIYGVRRMSWEEQVGLANDVPFLYLTYLSIIICLVSFVLVYLILKFSKKEEISTRDGYFCIICKKEITQDQFLNQKNQCDKCLKETKRNKLALYLELISCPTFFILNLIILWPG